MRENMTRREVREQLFVLLFQKEFYAENEFEEQMDTYFETHDFGEEQEAVKERLGSICEKLTEIDEQISAHSRGWKLDRIGKEELAILRLAVYEVIFDEEIPVGVAINEAVELGKKYGAEGGAAFINGMLGNIADE